MAWHWKPAILLANNSQHCWMLHIMLRPFAHPVACCWMLLRAVAQSLKPVELFSQQLPTVSFDPFAQLFQHRWGHARSLRMVYKDVWVVSFPRCTAASQHCWELLHPFAHHCQHARCCVLSARSLRMSRFWIIVTYTDKAEDKKQA